MENLFFLFRFTWKDMELAIARKIRRGKVALYDLWLHNL